MTLPAWAERIEIRRNRSSRRSRFYGIVLLTMFFFGYPLSLIITYPSFVSGKVSVYPSAVFLIVFIGAILGRVFLRPPKDPETEKLASRLYVIADNLPKIVEIPEIRKNLSKYIKRSIIVTDEHISKVKKQGITSEPDRETLSNLKDLLAKLLLLSRKSSDQLALNNASSYLIPIAERIHSTKDTRDQALRTLVETGRNNTVGSSESVETSIADLPYKIYGALQKYWSVRVIVETVISLIVSSLIGSSIYDHATIFIPLLAMIIAVELALRQQNTTNIKK